MTLRWGLIGRDKELTLLSAALADIDVQGVVLSGGSGVGKTRLVTELLEHAVNQGWVVHWAIGARGISGVPFGAFAHLLPRDAAASGSDEMTRWIADELRRSSGDRPIVLVADDAHLLDDISAGFMHLLASTAQAFVVAAVCHGERVPDSISSLWKDGLAQRVEVPALSRAKVGQLLGGVLSGQLDTATLYRLWDACQGNLLYLHELVLVGLERGRLAKRTGVWSWEGELACSDRLAELIEDRLAGLSHQQRTALEVLAVGEPLPAAMFGSVVGARMVQELHTGGLLTQERRRWGTSLRVAHPLYAESVRSGLGAVRRRTIYRQLADTLPASGAFSRDDVLRAALWRLESGVSGDPVTLVAGARQAHAMFDHQLAERLARAAVDEGGGIDARVMLAEALRRQGRYHEARAALLQQVPLAIRRAFLPGIADSGAADAGFADPGSAVLADWARVASSVFFWGFGDPGSAAEILRSAEHALSAGPDQERLVAHQATLAFFHGRPHDAVAAVQGLLTRPTASDEVTVAVRVAAVPALAILGQCRTALRLADEGMPAGIRLMDERPQLVGELLAMHAVAYWSAGQYRQMYDVANSVYQGVVAQKAHDLRGLWAMLLGRAALAAGQAATARHRLREACALLRQHDPWGLLPWALGGAALAAALLGDVENAQRILAEQRRGPRPAARVFEWDAVLAQAWVAATCGEHSAARRLACHAANLAVAGGLRCAELAALHDAVRLGALRVVPRLCVLAPTVDSVLAPVFASHAVALAAGNADALDACAIQFAELGAALLAAEAAAEAAELYHRDGRGAAQLAALRRSRMWAAACEGAQTPSLRRAEGSPVLEALTVREREIAELAARGLRKRDIAARLQLSVRTVGNHLNHIYTKTGSSGRAGLALLFGMQSSSLSGG